VHGIAICFLAFYIAAILFPFTHSLKHWKALKAGKEKFSLLFLTEGAFALLSALLVIGVSLALPGLSSGLFSLSWLSPLSRI